MSVRATAAAAVAAAVVVLVTTAPWHFSNESIWESCLVCGAAGGADALLNVLLFVPLGFLLVRSGLPWWLAVGVLLAGSAAIEVAQSYQPGRYATWGDVLANGIGAASGVALARLGPRWSRRLGSMGWGAGALLAVPGGTVLLMTAWLYQTSLPTSVYYGQWAPELGQFAPWPGRVVEARVGEERVTVGAHEDSRGLRRRLLAGAPVTVVAAPAGRNPQRPAPIFSIFDDEQREILVLGVAGADGVARIRRRAASLRLHWPFQSAPGLLLTAAGADGRVVYRWSEREASGCLEWGGRRTCGIREPISRGWATLLPVYLGGASWIADGIWLAILFAPLGCARGSAPAMFGASLLVLLAVAVPGIAAAGRVPAAAWLLTGTITSASYVAIRRWRSGHNRELKGSDK